MEVIYKCQFHLDRFHLVSSLGTFHRPHRSVSPYLRSFLFLLCASFCFRVYGLSTANLAHIHPVLAQNVKEFIHPRDFLSSSSPFFIEDGKDALGLPVRVRQEGNLYYRNGRFDIPAMSAAAEDLMKSVEEGLNYSDGAFNVFTSYFRFSSDNAKTQRRFSSRTTYQCLAIHTPYHEYSHPMFLTKMDHFELVNALFVEVDSKAFETDSEFRSFAYVEIDEDTGRPVLCGNTRVRASQVLHVNFTSPDWLDNRVYEPKRFECSNDIGFNSSICQSYSGIMNFFGGVEAKTSIPSKWRSIDWSQKAINASQVRTSSLFRTEISLPTTAARLGYCEVACNTAQAAVSLQLSEDNPSPIKLGTAVALILVPAVLGLLLTILEMILVITTSVIKKKWGKWIIFGLTLLDFGLIALAIIAAALELPKMNVPLIYSSWYTDSDPDIASVANVSSSIGDLQLEMWMLGEDLDAQWSIAEARSVTAAGLVLSCMNVVALVVPPLIQKFRKCMNREKKEETGGEVTSIEEHNNCAM